MLPLRFVFETFGFEVEWEGATHSALVTTGKNMVEEKPVEKPEEKPEQKPEDTTKPLSSGKDLANQTVILQLNDEQKATLYPNYKEIENAVHKVVLQENEKGEYIDIQAKGAEVSVDYFALEEPSRMVFDIPNHVSLMGSLQQEIEDDHIITIRTGQFDQDTTRIVLETKEIYSYEVSQINDETVRIQLLNNDGKVIVGIPDGSEEEKPEEKPEETTTEDTSVPMVVFSNDDILIGQPSSDLVSYATEETDIAKLPTSLATNPVKFTSANEDEKRQEIDATYSELDIEKKDFKETKVWDVRYKELGETKFFEILATSKISDVTAHVWNNPDPKKPPVFVIEVRNAHLSDDYKEFKINDNDIFESTVRSGNHVDTDTGENYAKIVFDVKNLGYKFNVKLNDIREKVVIEAVNNVIYDMNIGQNEIGDFVDITGVSTMEVEAFRLGNPERLVFDLPNTKSLVDEQYVAVDGQYMKEVRTSQFTNTTSRVVLEMKGQPDYEVIHLNDTTTRIQLHKNVYENIEYAKLNGIPSIVLAKKDGIKIENINFTNDYMKRKLTVTMPGNYAEFFTAQNINIYNGVFDTIQIQNNGANQTVMSFNMESVYEFVVEETEQFIAIKAYKPKQIYDHVLVVDPGHGDSDPGAIGRGKVYEKTVNLEVSILLKEIADADDKYKIYFTRIDDAYVSLNDRCLFANAVGADYFISIHANSFRSSVHGCEGYYTDDVTETFDVKGLSKTIVEAFAAGTDLKYRKNIPANFYVLKYTKMPAMLLEMGYLSNSSDLKLLADKEHQKKMANALHQGILNMFERYPVKSEKIVEIGR